VCSILGYRSLGNGPGGTAVEITNVEHRDLPRIAQKFLSKSGAGVSIAL
jgi:hypothetical protein